MNNNSVVVDDDDKGEESPHGIDDTYIDDNTQVWRSTWRLGR